jgi:hypothetical protein
MQGAITWYYNNANHNVANTGWGGAYLVAPATNCGYMWLGTSSDNYNYVKACNGATKTWNPVWIQQTDNPSAGGTWHFKLCTTIQFDNCVFVWSQQIYQNG